MTMSTRSIRSITLDFWASFSVSKIVIPPPVAYKNIDKLQEIKLPGQFLCWAHGIGKNSNIVCLQRAVTMIPAHDSPVAAMAFNSAGTKLSTASEKASLKISKFSCLFFKVLYLQHRWWKHGQSNMYLIQHCMRYNTDHKASTLERSSLILKS